jgi:hypothetical protein
MEKVWRELGAVEFYKKEKERSASGELFFAHVRRFRGQPKEGRLPEAVKIGLEVERFGVGQRR